MQLPSMTMMIIMAITLLATVQTSQTQNTTKEFLEAHNAARAQVMAGLRPFVWNESVAAYARRYANTHIGDCTLVHSPKPRPYGENLAGSTGDLSATAAVSLWIKEKVDYDYKSNSCRAGKVCGHYTQVVWRNSVRLGCAKVRCNNGGTFIICSYDPPGNVIGQWPY